MPAFTYKAVATDDRIFEGEIEAASADAAARSLQDRGQLPIRIDEAGRGAGRIAAGLQSRTRHRSSRQDLIFLLRELGLLLGAGLTLDHALAVMVRSARKDAVKTALGELRTRVKGGASLAEAMEGSSFGFPPFAISAIRAGEIGGHLEEVVARLAAHFERGLRLRGKIQAALIYPAILLVMAGLSLTLLLTLVVPAFGPLFESAGAELPLITTVVIGIAEGTRDYGWLAALLIIGAFFAARMLLRDPAYRERWDRAKLGLPLFGPLLSKIAVALSARLLGTLLANGVALATALALVRETSANRALASAFDTTLTEVKEGHRLAESLESTGVFPAMAVDLLKVGEEAGQLETMLERIAEIYDEEVARSLDRLIAILVPAVTLLLGVLIAGIIASVLLAMLSINQLAV